MPGIQRCISATPLAASVSSSVAEAPTFNCQTRTEQYSLIISPDHIEHDLARGYSARAYRKSLVWSMATLAVAMPDCPHVLFQRLLISPGFRRSRVAIFSRNL